MDITEMPEYWQGWKWAKENRSRLAELFTSKEVATPELRTHLFREAAVWWPSRPDDLKNDLRQTAFVAGAIKAVIETLPLTREALVAVVEAGQEMGVIWGVEQAKIKSLEELKKKPRGWWQRKFGDATPNQIVGALSIAWRREKAKERGRPDPRSRWEVLIDQLSSRELGVLANLERIEERRDTYDTYLVESPDTTFQIIARNLYEDGRLYRYAGEIVG